MNKTIKIALIVGVLTIIISTIIAVVVFRRDEEPTSPIPPQTSTGKNFQNPERVAIEGYAGDVMEPGLSKDGKYLAWNNNGTDKNIYWAERIDDTHFKYVGPLSEVNSETVDSSPSFDLEGNIYYSSVANLSKNKKTLYKGLFDNGKVKSIETIEGDFYSVQTNVVSIDPDISPQGDYIYFSTGKFGDGPVPTSLDIGVAKKKGDRYIDDKSIVENINTSDLEYAPTISSDGKEIFFTRTNLANGTPIGNDLYVARRNSTNESFQKPVSISTVDTFVEAPTISLDGRSLYFHAKEGEKYVLYRMTR